MHSPSYKVFRQEGALSIICWIERMDFLTQISNSRSRCLEGSSMGFGWLSGSHATTSVWGKDRAIWLHFRDMSREFILVVRPLFWSLPSSLFSTWNVLKNAYSDFIINPLVLSFKWWARVTQTMKDAWTLKRLAFDGSLYIFGVVAWCYDWAHMNPHCHKRGRGAK